MAESSKDVYDEDGSVTSDEEGSVSSDLNRSVTSALKTPDVPRLVVPGLLGAVLQKFGQKPDKLSSYPKKVTAPVHEKSVKKGKIAKKSATPKKFPKLARISSTSAGKVVKWRAHNTGKSSKQKTAPKKSLASRSSQSLQE